MKINLNTNNEFTGIDSLPQAIAQAVAAVKSQPASSDLRMRLFKLYCLQADWDRALRQLDIVEKTDDDTQRQCELFKNLILSERLRQLVLAGQREAGNLGDALPEWCELLNKANAFYHEGEATKGEEYRHRALEAATAMSGKSEGLETFDWIADGDDRLGPVCEFIFAGGYRWVPFSDIEVLNVEKPNSLTDLIWAPATVVVKGQTHRGYIPSRYPLNSESDVSLLTGSRTEWQESESDRYIGQGRKMWVSSSGECSLFEAGEISI